MFSTLFLLLTHRWKSVGILLLFLWLIGLVRFPKSQRAIDFFIPALSQGFGGVTIIRNDLISGVRPRVYAIHPHAILSNGLGMAMNDCVSRGEHVTVAASSLLYWFNPFFHWFVNSMGCGFSSVTKRDLERIMRCGKSIALVPGGFEELMLTEERKDVVYLRNRKGFVKLCQKFKYDIVPVFAFGESMLYRNRIPLTSFIKRISARMKTALVLPVGESVFNFMPSTLPKGLLVVFGKPISCREGNDLNDLHKKYLENLINLYHTYNPYSSTELKIL